MTRDLAKQDRIFNWDLIEFGESGNMRSHKQTGTRITDMRFAAKPTNLQK